MSETERVEIVDDFLVMTVGLYEFFMANEANDQLRVYLHLLYTARRQQTRSVWANTQYISKGCDMGIGRVKSAKAWLAAHGVIEYRQDPQPGKNGKGKVYIVLNTRIKAGGTESSLPEKQATREPASEVLREQEELPREQGIEATPPATEIVPIKYPRKHFVRDETWHAVADLTVERGGPWAAGVKEAVCMDKLMTWAKLKANGHHAAFLKDFADGAWALHEGTVMGLRQRDVDFWKAQPYTPSRLLCNASAICAVLENLEEANRPLTPEQMHFATMGMK